MSDPLSPKSPRKGKIVNIRILFLDDTLHAFQVPVKAVGSALWEAVIKHLQLLESDYFDLNFVDCHELQCWLDREKPILKQLPSSDTPLRFCIKFYTPDPGLLEDEYTRYLFALQIKRDLATGEMPCSENTAALLASYIAQAEIGDCPVDDYTDHTYLSGFKFVPHQTLELEKKIMDYHRQHVGESPAESDLNLLDTARKVECYGVKIQSAKDHEAVPLNLAVAHVGVLVFQNSTKINTFSWAKVRKLSFKRKKFLIKLHPENYGYYKDTVEFFFESRNECKCFWKKCIEHHAFFRCHAVKKLPRNKTRVVSRGSSFRYSGRTQKQLIEHVRETFVKRPPFERTISGRISSRSTSVTPKIHPKTAIHNSSDLHNSTASSGSHTLERTHDSRQLANRLETAEVHSDSSMSGSRSLGSPKLDRDQSQDEPRVEGAEVAVDTCDEIDEPQECGTAEKAEISNGAVYIPPVPAHSRPIDRKFSAPVFGGKEALPPSYVELEKHLSRCEEVENIPSSVEETKGEARRESLQRSVSAVPVTEENISSPNKSIGVYLTEPEPTTEREQEPNTRPISLTDNEPLPLVDQSEDESPPLPSPPPIIEQSGESPPPSPPPPLPPPPLDENYICLSPPSQRSTPKKSNGSTVSTGGLPSNVSVLSSVKTEDSEEDSKRKIKRHPVDRAYYIAKELLMTERTYKKDLEVITVWFCNAVSADEGIPEYVTSLFVYLDPIYQFHCGFLKEIDQRLSMWEGKSNAHLNGNYQKIGDIMLNSFSKVLELYKMYLERQESILYDLEQAVKKHETFELIYKDFESQKVCYLPLNTFLLKPSQRLLHIKLVLERLTKHYPMDHPDYSDCSAALNNIVEVVSVYRDSMKQLDNLQKLMELQRDLVGIDNLIQPHRDFIREGCLQKFSRKGYQQRMFFLFSDVLVYTSRSASALLQFKVHGELPLKGMLVEESEQARMAVQNSFAIYGGNKCILVAASSQEEKDKWIEDLNECIARAKSENDKLSSASLKSSSSENVSNQDGKDGSAVMSEKQIQHRANTSMHVCWHRNTSVSMRDHEKAIKNQLSGYLLRKFKNSNGWQKLWVVFTNFCLFFYKSYQDDFPLASLPLLGYAVNTPGDEDNIHKDHVFKLQFKNHIYFFRAESEYTFSRWMEVINCATNSAHRTRLFSRLDSRLDSSMTVESVS